MREYEYVKEYIDATNRFFLYLVGCIYNNEGERKYLFEGNYFPLVKTSLIGSILMGFKEKIVDKDNDYYSKLYDNVLTDIVRDIKNNLVSGDKLFNNDAYVVFVIRNKLAHGDYRVDVINNRVDFFVDNNKYSIDIDKLCLFVVRGFYSTIGCIKDNVCVHGFCRYDYVDNKDNLDVREVISNCKCYLYKIIGRDGNVLSRGVLELFNKFISILKDSSNDKLDMILDMMRISFDFLNIDLVVDEIKVNDVDKIEGMFNKVNNGCDLSYDKQLEILIDIIELECLPYVSELRRDISYVRHFNRILELEKGIDNGCEIRFEELCSALVIMFNSMFIYNFESLFDYKGNYQYDRSDCFDFSLLNLDRFNVKTLVVDNKFVDIAFNNCKSSWKKYKNTWDSMEKTLNNFMRVKKEDVKVVNRLEKMIGDIKESLVKDMEYFNNSYSEYIMYKDDFYNNYDYFKKRSIIVGIRHAIAHGNYKFMVRDNSTFLMFKDVYNGELILDVEIELKDFIDFIYDSIRYIDDFINKKNNKRVLI